MGLFRKKSKSTLSLVSVSSADKGGKNDVPKGRRRRSNSAQEQSVLQTKPSHSVREIKPATRYSEESAVSINSTTGSTASSKRPKLRLRKSISALVQGIPRPRQSTAKSDQASQARPRSMPAKSSSTAVSPMIPAIERAPSLFEDVNWPLTPEASAQMFSLPFNAPPVPPSPIAEQLEFPKSSQPYPSTSSRLPVTTSHPSSTTNDLPTLHGRTTTSALFERRIVTGRVKPRLYIPNFAVPTEIQTAPVLTKYTRSRYLMSPDTHSSIPRAFKFGGMADNFPSPISSSKDDESSDITSVWSNLLRRQSSYAESILATSDDNGEMEAMREEVIEREGSSPAIEFIINSERKIANARLCDVLRTLFGSNGSVGITPECKMHLKTAKEPRILEIALRLRAPCLASYADDYPHGKYYIACMADVGDLLAEDRDVPLEAALGSQTSFAKLDFPDNFFDVIVAGGAQFMFTKPQWPAVLTELHRILKPGGWLDFMTVEASFQSCGPITRSYNDQLLTYLEKRNMYPNPGSTILPLLIRHAGFRSITRAQVLVPTFWRDTTEPKVCIRNKRNGEEMFMTMSEIGDRVSTLMYGFWEEMFGEWDDSVEDFKVRNRKRRAEALDVKAWSLICKIGARKKGKIKA